MGAILLIIAPECQITILPQGYQRLHFIFSVVVTHHGCRQAVMAVVGSHPRRYCWDGAPSRIGRALSIIGASTTGTVRRHAHMILHFIWHHGTHHSNRSLHNHKQESEMRRCDLPNGWLQLSPFVSKSSLCTNQNFICHLLLRQWTSTKYYGIV